MSEETVGSSKRGLRPYDYVGYQPSGHFNVSRARELYLNYNSSFSSSPSSDWFVTAQAINFILMSTPANCRIRIVDQYKESELPSLMKKLHELNRKEFIKHKWARDTLKSRMEPLKEEICKYVFHPSKIQKWVELGNDPNDYMN